MEFLELCKNLKKDYSTFRSYKIAWISDDSTQFVTKALRGEAYNQKFNLKIYECGLGLAEVELLNPASEFFDFKPDATVFYHSYTHFQQSFYKSTTEKRKDFARNFISKLQNQFSILKANGISTVFCGTIPELPDPVYGSLGLNKEDSLISQIRLLNKAILNCTKENSDVHVLPIHSFVAQIGYVHFYDPQLYFTSGSDISFSALPDFAKFTLERVLSFAGKIIKCVIVDLDNTLWGGIAGDDGWEKLEIGNLGKGKVFIHIQQWLKELKNRGILLVVCSKNEESIAREVFEKHPEMVLKTDDFVLFVANWETKSKNLAYIQKSLNISYACMVFLDDNAAEREQVRQSLPEIQIPELPRDASEWMVYLQKQNLFETPGLTEEDANRSLMYQNQKERINQASGFEDQESYLKSLEMKAKIEKIDSYNMPRVAQLTQRTNQFNLRTIRYSENEIRNLIENEGHEGFAISLRDKYGDEGIVSFVLLKKCVSEYFIDTWVMSCRVFGRGLENLVFEYIIEKVNAQNLIISAEYIQSPKNKYVENLLPGLGFELQDTRYILACEKAVPHKHYIHLDSEN